MIELGRTAYFNGTNPISEFENNTKSFLSCFEYVREGHRFVRRQPEIEHIEANTIRLDMCLSILMGISIGSFNNIFYTCGRNSHDFKGLLFFILNRLDGIQEEVEKLKNNGGDDKKNILSDLMEEKRILKQEENDILLHTAIIQDYLTELVTFIRSEYLVKNLVILDKWEDLYTLFRPKVFFTWAKKSGFVLPSQVDEWLTERKGKGNTTGSNKDKPRIDYTLKYCEQVLAEILRKDEIDISRDEFQKRIKARLKKGETMHHDTFRDFIVNSVPPERKTPQGRKRKK